MAANTGSIRGGALAPALFSAGAKTGEASHERR